MAPSEGEGRRWRPLSGSSLLLIGSAPLLVFLLAPTLIVTPMALTKGNIIQFPPVWISVHAFTDYLNDPEWMADTFISLRIAVLATIVACAVGTSTALALFHLRGPVRGAVSSLVMLPMMAPVIVLALGDYLALSRVGLVGSWPMIALAHSLLGAPYVVLSVQTSLGGLNQALVRSARSLGAGDLAVLRHVYWPAIRPGLLAGAVFAFYGSFDEVILSLFLQGPGVVTLPVQMFTSIQYELTPKIAAVSSLLVFFAAAVLIGQALLTRTGARAISVPEAWGVNLISPTAELAAGDAYLALDHVWKAYGPAAEPVVRDISFVVDQGQFVTLLGPSGSGKTTTLMMAAGFEEPTRGRIFARGRDVSALPANRRDFGVVFQGYALFPHMSVRDNVEFPLRMRRVEGQDRRRRAMDLLDKVGLAAFADRRPRELSGGQQQRVALARALAFQPDVLLLDEPLGALDKKMRETLQGELKEIQRNMGVSVLFITHDQEEAMMMSDVICVMEDGRIAQTGSPEDIYNDPADAFVATFLGETNLMPCELCGAEQGLTTVRMADGMSCVARSGKAKLGGAQRTALSLRPERVRLLAPQETADNVAEAQLIERVFLGQQVRYTVRAFGQLVVVISGPAEGPPIDVGERLRIGWSRDAGQILAAD